MATLKRSALLALRVTPKAAHDALRGWHDGQLRVAVTAAPDRGRANAAVIALLAEVLDVPRGAITLVSGQTQPRKRLRVDGIDEATVQARIAAALRS